MGEQCCSSSSRRSRHGCIAASDCKHCSRQTLCCCVFIGIPSASCDFEWTAPSDRRTQSVDGVSILNPSGSFTAFISAVLETFAVFSHLGTCPVMFLIHTCTFHSTTMRQK